MPLFLEWHFYPYNIMITMQQPKKKTKQIFILALVILGVIISHLIKELSK